MVKLAEHPQPKSARTIRVAVIDGLLSLSARIVPEPDGGYSCSVPSLPGCFSCGDTYEEACAMIAEASRLHFSCVIDEFFRRSGPRRPSATRSHPSSRPESVLV